MIRSLKGIVGAGPKMSQDVKPSIMLPSSPLWSGLVFARLRRNSKVDEDVECPSSPFSISCSSLTTRSSSESCYSNVLPAIFTNGVSKIEGMCVIDDNVSPTVYKRFRFEEYCVDYERLERKERKRLRKERRKQRKGLRKAALHKLLKKLLVYINDLLDLAWVKLSYIHSIAWQPRDGIMSVKKRRCALRGCRQIVQKKLDKITRIKRSVHTSPPPVVYNPEHINHVHSNL